MKKLLLALCGLLTSQFSSGQSLPDEFVNNCGANVKAKSCSVYYASLTDNKLVKGNWNLTITYDEHGSLKNVTDDFFGHRDFSYDKGNLMAIHSYTKKDDLFYSYEVKKDSMIMREYEYEFDSLNSESDAKPSLYDIVKANIDAHGNMLTAVTYSFLGEAVDTVSNLYDYNAAGQLTKQRIFDSKGKLTQTIEKVYDGKGIIIMAKKVYAKDSTKEVTQYNEHGDPVEFRRYAADGSNNNWIKTSYKYDDHGNWIEKSVFTNNRGRGSKEYYIKEIVY